MRAELKFSGWVSGELYVTMNGTGKRLTLSVDSWVTVRHGSSATRSDRVGVRFGWTTWAVLAMRASCMNVRTMDGRHMTALIIRTLALFAV